MYLKKKRTLKHARIMREFSNPHFDGSGRFRTATLSARLTSGVQRFRAPYMGRFIPWRAERLRVEWRAKHREAGRKARPACGLTHVFIKEIYIRLKKMKYPVSTCRALGESWEQGPAGRRRRRG